jgi:hypothetical protein
MRRAVVLAALCAVTLVQSRAWCADRSLVLYLPFDDGTGKIATDASSYKNDATIVGNAAWVEGYSGSALEFVAGSHVTVPEIPDYDVTSQLSVMAWVKTSSVPNWCRVVDKSQYQTSGFDLVLTQNVGLPRLEFFVNNTTSLVDATTAVMDNRWHFIAGTFGNKTLKVYVDGVRQGQATSANNVDINPNSWPVMVGGESSSTGGQQYFGDIDEVAMYNRELAEEEIMAIFRNGMPSAESASKPQPDSKVVDVPRDATLGWQAGQYAQTHDVYFGTAFDDVNNASRANPTGVLVSQGQTAATYDPAGLLAFGQTCYWRVDEVNGAPDFFIYKGSVWNFTVETYGYPVKPVKAAASSSSNALMGPEKTIDGSGMDALDQHSTSSSHMWLSKKNSTPIWIKYDFDKVYKLYEMWVWNSNQATEPDVGFGAKSVTVETSLDGTTWTTLGSGPVEFNQATGEPNYTHNTTVEFGGVQAQYVRLTINTNWADGTKQAGLSEVRFFYVPVKAYGSTPASGATAVAIDSTLNWRPGREAVKHQVYLGTDPNSLALAKTTSEHSLALSSVGLEYGRTYYWKVNEVNDAATPASWEGDVWNFTTPDYGVVDDFESYNDNCNRIFFAWVDGFGYSASADCGLAASAGNGTGSTVGNTNPPFAERDTIHGGKQAMPLAYDNTSGAGTSEAIRTFASAQDWTLGGAKTLVLFFRGGSDNGAGQFYATINGVKVTYTGSATALSAGVWKQWNIDLASLGTNLKAVKTLAIGVSGTGKGTVYVDDIRLYRAAPAPVVPVDPASNGLSLWYRMEGNVKDSSGKGLDGTAVGNPAYVEGPAGYGQALSFEGIDDEVDLPIGALISTSTSMTVGTWVSFNNTGGSWQRLWDFGNSSSTGYMFLCPRQGTSGSMRFAITSAAGAGESVVNAPMMLPSGWHYVAVVIDGSSKTVQIWLDGDIAASGPTATLPSALGKTTQNWLGRSQYAADAYLTGSLDELRIYSRALTAGEIRYLTGDR